MFIKHVQMLEHKRKTFFSDAIWYGSGKANEGFGSGLGRDLGWSGRWLPNFSLEYFKRHTKSFELLREVKYW